VTAPLDCSVVVGVDGSPVAQAALGWAAREALARGTGLVVAHATDATRALRDIDGPPQQTIADAREQGRHLLEQAVASARQLHPEIEVTGILRDDGPEQLLGELGQTARLLVLGVAQKRAGAPRLRASTVHQVVAAAACPVVVVPAVTERREGPVTVGVSPSRGGVAAVRFAFAAAALYGAGVVAARVWGDGETVVDGYDTQLTLGDGPGAAHVTARYALATVQPFHPDVPVRVEALEPGTEQALQRVSADARLLVLGPRDAKHALARLGPVAARLIESSHCPVAVVPASAGGAAER
jgi:nucleotide-binding universal stress UspA family protein